MTEIWEDKDERLTTMDKVPEGYLPLGLVWTDKDEKMTVEYMLEWAMTGSWKTIEDTKL